MTVNKLFRGTVMDFTKKCKLRIGFSVGLMFLGGLALLAASLYGSEYPAMISDISENQDFVRGFYVGTGYGLIAAAIITIIKNVRLLKNQELQKKRMLYENDERNRLIGTKTWAYTGYAMFLLLYVGILVSGFYNLTVLKVLLGVLGVYGGLLLIFKTILQRIM